MVITSDGQKTNLGLSLKFEAKGMKVLDYSQKSANGRGWEYSDKAIHLIHDYKVGLDFPRPEYAIFTDVGRISFLPSSRYWTLAVIVSDFFSSLF